MKCKVCGYEFDSSREFCPMCGSKVPEALRRKEEEEMSWNTYDFPKPKKPEDIEMHWPGMGNGAGSSVSVMKKDASEGFVQSGFPAKEEPKPKKEEPVVSPWAAIEKDFPKSAVPVEEPATPEYAVTPPPRQEEPAAPSWQTPPPAPAPQPQPQTPPTPAAQPSQPAFPQGAWQMPQMQETPSWTPYNVQTQQPSPQIPPISPAYAPTSFTQQYGSQYSQPRYTQPQTAWTIPSQPQPGQQVYVTQAAQPVFIQPAPPAPQPIYTPVYPQYTQPQPPVQPAAPQPAPAAPAQSEPAPMPQPEAEPVPQPAPAPAEAAPEPQTAPMEPEPGEKILEENIVASIEPQTEEPAPAPEKREEKPLFEPEKPLFEPETHEEPEPDEDGRYPERFFTFNKKNEEFQQLLNQEYERLRNLHGGDFPGDLSRTSIYKKNTFQPTPAQDFFHDNELSNDLSEFERMLLESTKDAEGDETLTINRDRIKGAAITAEDLIDPLPAKPGDTQPLSEPEQTEEPAPAEPEIPLTKEEIAKAEHRKRMEAMAKAREAYFASLRTMTAEMRAVKDAEFKAQLEKEARITHEDVVREAPVEKTPEEIAAEKAEEARLVAEREAAERKAAIERAKAEMEAAREAQLKEQEEAGLADELDRALQQAAEKEEKPAAEPEKPEEPEAPAAEEPEKSEEVKEPGRDKTEVLSEILDDVEEETLKKEKREHSHWFLKFLLALIIVAAAAEGGTIALRHYAPESPASVITTGIEQNVIQFVQSGIDAIKSKFSKEETPVEPVDGPQQPGEEDVSFVLSDIIAESNKNIESVVENLGIGYDSQRAYDIPGLSSSELVTDPAEKAAVCKTLIGYNSSWIDYVNGANQDCLYFLKADGSAYRSAVTFDKIGQIVEKFLKLEIGEIRKTADSYFVFAGESIEVTQDETTAQSSGFMLYEMVPVGEELKIKEYYNITN